MTQGFEVKICGITNIVDRDTVIASGANYVGAIVGVAQSPRSLDLAQAAVLLNTRDISRVVVLMNPERDYILSVADGIRPDIIQLHGHETSGFVADLKQQWKGKIWKVLAVPKTITDRKKVVTEIREDSDRYVQAGVDAILLDTSIATRHREKVGGTGQPFDWTLLDELAPPSGISFFIAGGVRPDNLSTLLSCNRVNGIDVSSGVEAYPGKKDPVKIRNLMQVVRNGLRP